MAAIEHSCPVPFCCEGCQLLPHNAHVIRASVYYICRVCGKPARDHEPYAYPTGTRHVFKTCDGIFVHTLSC